TKPMICGNQVNFTGSANSCPSAWAILFSKPSPASFEKGRLLGSAHTRNSGRETRSPVGDCAKTGLAPPPVAATPSAVSVCRHDRQDGPVTRILLFVHARRAAAVEHAGRAGLQIGVD